MPVVQLARSVPAAQNEPPGHTPPWFNVEEPAGQYDPAEQGCGGLAVPIVQNLPAGHTMRSAPDAQRYPPSHMPPWLRVEEPLGQY
jgi:hypothetical protein